ncbi:MAG: MBOAT family O-acyltransferase [Oscillospiraceae bacterium]|nr:MBOAT family O-acyltransferase [Oscillospiraceae bacterium]
MLFSSIPFLYYFLPVVLILYFLAPGKCKNTVLLLASLFFYGWGEPKLLLLMLFTIALFYLCGLAIDRAEEPRRRKLWLTISVVISLALLGLFKYADFFIASFNAAAGVSLPLLKLALPVGISFYTFQCLSYTIDVYRGSVPAQKNLIAFGAYVALFPQLIAGPIVRYADIARELEHRSHSWEDGSLGLRRFLTGLGKKVILADNLALFIKLFRESGEPSVLFYWMYAIAFTLNIYFDFSGYSDMAIGLGRIFGFRFMENFNYPYLSGSVTEFWRRWHMSLGSWFRDYVYIPLGGSRVSRGRWVRNILAVWMLTGLWHGAAWNFVLWGLFFAALLLMEKWVPALQKLPGFLRHGYVLLAVVLSFVLFNAESLRQAGGDFAALFGFGGLPLVTAETLYYLRSYAVLFAVACFGATPLPKMAAKWAENTWFGRVLEPIFLVGLLLISTAYLVDGSFSPFLYFRF